MYRNFREITSKAKELGPVRVAVLFPHSGEVIRATADAMNEGLIVPLLVGNRDQVRKADGDGSLDLEKVELIERPEPQDAADLCLDMTARGDARFVMKGSVLTTYLYRALIRKTKELAPDQTPCTLCFHELTGLDKLFVVTDPGVNILPEFEFKKKILRTAVSIVRKLGYTAPRIMALAAPRVNGSESFFDKEAERLSALAEEGHFGDCEFCAARDFMNAFLRGQIRTEEFPDIFLVPNIEAGNILVKTIDHLLLGIRQCTTIGGGVITLTPSRSDGYEERMTNIALGMVLSVAREGN